MDLMIAIISIVGCGVVGIGLGFAFGVGYRKKFAECFNLATLPFYWNSLEPKEGEHR